MFCVNFYLILFFVVTSVVYCNESGGYYVVQMPIEHKTSPVKHTKQLNVYWNVPTMQCKSKRIPFTNLHEDFGIIQNKNDSFRGDKISILYDPGVFPALLKNESSGRFIFRNGGVPQEGDLSRHLEEFRKVLNESVPDENFNGIGIIDFESWRPVYRQNFGILSPYKDISYEIEQSRHWYWPKNMLIAEAVRRFESSAIDYMNITLKVAKEMRPRAQWGYYAYPYCFNMAGKHMNEKCANNVPEENDRISWLWSSSTALYPSVYTSKDLNSDQLAKMLGGRVREARRLNSQTPILPYFWFKYREGGFLSEKHVKVTLETLYKSNASGFIIWGSSNDVNTKAKCLELYHYVNTVLGPAIAKYTKKDNRVGEINEEDVSDINNNNSDEFKLNNTNSEPDPEFHWTPPENYTQDIISYVENEFGNKSVLKNITDDNHTSSTNEKVKENNLIDLLVNFLFKPKVMHDDVIDINKNNSDNLSTVNPLEIDISNESLYEISTMYNILDNNSDTTTFSTKMYDKTIQDEYANILIDTTTTELPYAKNIESTDCYNNNPCTTEINSISESVLYETTLLNLHNKNYMKGIPRKKYQDESFTTNDDTLSTTVKSYNRTTEDFFTTEPIINNEPNEIDYETTTVLSLEITKELTNDGISDKIRIRNKNFRKGLRYKIPLENESIDKTSALYLPTTDNIFNEFTTDNSNYDADKIKHSKNRRKGLSNNRKKENRHKINHNIISEHSFSIINETMIENTNTGKNIKKGLPKHNRGKVKDFHVMEPFNKLEPNRLNKDNIDLSEITKNVKKGISQLNKRNEIKTDNNLSTSEETITEKQLNKRNEIKTDNNLSTSEETITEKQLNKRNEIKTDNNLSTSEETITEKQLNKRNEIKTDDNLSTSEETITEKQDKNIKKGLPLRHKLTLNSNFTEVATSMGYSTTDQVIVYDVIRN